MSKLAIEVYEACFNCQIDKVLKVVTNHIKELPSMQMEKRVINRKGYYPPFQPQVERHKREGRNELRQQLINELEQKETTE